MPLKVVEQDDDFHAEIVSAQTGDLICVFLHAEWQPASKSGSTFSQADFAKLAESRSEVRFFDIDAGSEVGEELALSLGVNKFPALRVYQGSSLSKCAFQAEGQDVFVANLADRITSLLSNLKNAADVDMRDAVRGAYAQTAAGGASVLPGDAGDPHKRSKLLGYDDAKINESADLGLGCGNPLLAARLQPGEAVLDLGSGAGMDCFMAAKEVGPTGLIIGVDMTPEMLSKARATARKDQISNVSFRLGEIEHLPLGDQVVNCVISNCVINLSTEKTQVYREMNRVLVPGGRISISDVLRMGDIPKELQTVQSYAC
jgi:2-polyprenyl-3-methyl-5-hydroxy-6-metoxy-1,4-benzoquinol methylase